MWRCPLLLLLALLFAEAPLQAADRRIMTGKASMM